MLPNAIVLLEGEEKRQDFSGVVSWAEHPIFEKHSTTLWAPHNEAKSPQVLGARGDPGRAGRVLKAQGRVATASLAVAMPAMPSELL